MRVIETEHEAAKFDVVLAKRLRDAHPMSKGLAALGRAGSASDFSVDGQGANVAFGGVVVGGDVRVVNECEDAVEVLVEACLESRDIGIHAKVRVGDEPPESDAHAVAGGRVAAGLGDAACFVEGAEAVSEKFSDDAGSDLGDLLGLTDRVRAAIGVHPRANASCSDGSG